MTLDPMVTQWFHIPRPVIHPRLRLLCFPYAGGSATLFQSWPRSLPSDVELWALKLPGRGHRYSEPPITRLERLLDALVTALARSLEAPFLFYGHSMGALVAFALARRLQLEGLPTPKSIVVSGRRAPQLKPLRPQTYSLSTPEFWAEVRRLNGTPEVVFQEPELMELLLPILRADFELIETWVYKSMEPLNIPLFVWGGTEDSDVPKSDLDLWQVQTQVSCFVRQFQGNHFFINTHAELFLSALAEVCRR